MPIKFPPNLKKYSSIVLFIISFAPLLFAQEGGKDIPETKKGAVIFGKSIAASSPKNSSQKEESLTEVQRQARIYRNQGLEWQRIGNLEGALALYQKAIQLDPTYAVAYNDLGVIYETSGDIARAEESYQEAITIDPNYLSGYSNLALLYENKRDLNKAAFYWQKRVVLGSPDDPWTEKAKQRLEDIRIVLGNKGMDQIRDKEDEVIGLMKDVQREKSVLSLNNKALAKKHFEKAKRSYEEEDYATARKEALDAQQLDPTNREIEKFIEKVQTRALSK